MGETVVIKNVSRYCDDIYECVADNGVPPAVSRQMRVTVECEYYFVSNDDTILVYCVTFLGIIFGCSLMRPSTTPG